MSETRHFEEILPRGREPFPLLSSPVRVFALVLLLVFAVEGGIMAALSGLPDAAREPWLVGLIDATALTAIIAPVVWLMLVRPLRRSLELRGQLLRRLFDSQEKERARIARELHDGVGQNLTALLVGFRGVADATDVETAVARARDLQSIVSFAHGEVRSLARGLHPVILVEHGLVSAIERLCQGFERTHGIEVVFDAPAEAFPGLSPPAKLALYRVAQEALANTARHARPSRVEVALRTLGRTVALRVADDGAGMDSATASGFGLGSIRERVLMLGGRCRVHSRPGRGTAVEVQVPTSA